jgi:hypothetical protein
MTSITLNWTKAADDYTPQSSLQYRVYRSASGNIDTAANATANGTLVQDWTSDIGTCPASSLTLDTLYYFNVVVRDAASPENRRAYTMISQRTAPSNVNDYEVFWKLNNLDDSSGHNHTLLNFGATSAQNRALTPNASYDLSSNLMSVYDASELNFTSGLTISLWIYVTGNPVNDQKMIARFNTANNRGYAFGIINNHLYPEVYNSLGNHFTYNDGAITLSANQWYHVTMTWKTNEYLKTYVNGTLDKSIAVNNNSIGQVSDAFFTLGSGSDGAPTFRFAGLVDDIRIYGRELSQTEVQFLANLPAD